jgi:hypothetical protein
VHEQHGQHGARLFPAKLTTPRSPRTSSGPRIRNSIACSGIRRRWRRCARRAGTRWAVRIAVVALLLAIAVVAVLLLLTVV